jgi:N-acetylglucosaminyldiphosphoundecaprenol N-acetyl-beta-D-mannosaminyltransferase
MPLNLTFWLTKKTDYDLFADEFDETRKRPWSEMEFFQKHIHERFKDSPKKPELLDIGCGNGRATGLLEDAGAKVTGVDVSKKIITHAKQKHPGKEFVVGNMTSLPFPNTSQDILTAFASIPHLPNTTARKTAFRECFRVLRPGGILFGTAWNLDQKQFASSQKKARIRSILPWWDKNDFVIPWGEKKIPRMYHRFTADSLKKHLRSAGFEDVEIFSIVHGKKAPPSMGRNICFLAKKPTRIQVLSVPFDVLTFQESLAKLYQSVQTKKQTFVITPNPEICIEAQKNPAFRHVLDSADISVTDGMGILWASDYLYYGRGNRFFSLLHFLLFKKSRILPERVCGSDLFGNFCKRSRQGIFLLGSSDEVLEKCVKRFGNHIVGTDSGKSTPDDEARIIKKINDSGAKVLFVAFGAPAQEMWIHKNLKKLPNIRLAVGVGGSFDFAAGVQVRAPKVFQKLGMEWLYRLFREPKKRMRRIWTAVWEFPKAVEREVRMKNFH